MGADKTYTRRIADHECTYCGCKLPDGYTFRKCEKCRKDWSEIAKYARKTAKKNGICTVCKTREARPGRKTCVACATKLNEVAKARRDKLKAMGLCIICGKTHVLRPLFSVMNAKRNGGGTTIDDNCYIILRGLDSWFSSDILYRD